MTSTFSLAPDFWDTASNAVSAALEWEVKKSSSPGESCMYGMGWVRCVGCADGWSGVGGVGGVGWGGWWGGLGWVVLSRRGQSPLESVPPGLSTAE